MNRRDEDRGFLGLNGGLDRVRKAFDSYWRLGVIIVAAVSWVLTQNGDHRDQQKLQKTVEHQVAVQDDVHIEVKLIRQYMRDSLTTDADLFSLWKQANAAHVEMWHAIDKLEGVKPEHMDRPKFYEGYGPIPEKYRNWFEWYVDKGNSPTGGVQ